MERSEDNFGQIADIFWRVSANVWVSVRFSTIIAGWPLQHVTNMSFFCVSSLTPQSRKNLSSRFKKDSKFVPSKVGASRFGSLMDFEISFVLSSCISVCGAIFFIWVSKLVAHGVKIFLTRDEEAKSIEGFEALAISNFSKRLVNSKIGSVSIFSLAIVSCGI